MSNPTGEAYAAHLRAVDRIRDASTLERAEHWGDELTAPSGRRVAVALAISLTVAVLAVWALAHLLTTPILRVGDHHTTYPAAADIPPAGPVQLTEAPAQHLRIPATFRLAGRRAP